MRPIRPARLLACAMAVASLALVFATRPAPVTAAGRAGQVADNISSVPRVSIDQLRKLVDADGVIVIDVRGPQEYNLGHIPGAILVPLETVAARAGEWKNATKPIVTYCT